MFTADAHCDALWQMEKGGSFKSGDSLRVNSETLRKGHVNVQNFALFAMPSEPKYQQRKKILKQIDLFHQHIIPHEQMVWNPGKKIDSHSSLTQAILSLEGAGMFGDNLKHWKKLQDAGVEMASLTWNEKNKLASGSGQSNKHGLTKAGRKVIKWMNENSMVVDLAHLNEKSFWAVMEYADLTAVSHANVRGLFDHPRNLWDSQIKALRSKYSFIGLTFYPPFLNGKDTANCSDLARQIEYLCERGVSDIIGFGSDFDGTETTIKGIRSPVDFPLLIDWLLKHFDESVVRGIAGENFKRFWNRTRRDQILCKDTKK